MNSEQQYFKFSKFKEHLYELKENISVVHLDYTNDPLNLYLTLESHSVLLVDTWYGLFPLKPLVKLNIFYRLFSNFIDMMIFSQT